MTVWMLGVVVGACMGVARVTRRLAGEGPTVVDDVGFPGGSEAARGSLSLLRPWLVVGPVWFLAAFALLEVADLSAGFDPWLLAAEVLGLLPVAGLLVSTGVAMWRVGDAQVASDDPAARVVGWSLVIGAGALVGLVVTVALRWVGAAF